MRRWCLPALLLFLSIALDLGDSVRLVNDEEATAHSTRHEAAAQDGQKARSSMLYNVPMMTKLRDKLREVAFREDGTLKIPKEHVKGKCSHWDDFTQDDMGSKEWQCPNTKWIYEPTPDMNSHLRTFFGNPSPVEEKDVKPEINADGSAFWCGNSFDEDIEPANAQQFWNTCALAGAGYINALRCKDDTVYVILGLTAMSHGICYPAHTHHYDEAFWAVGGGGRFRRWISNAVPGPSGGLMETLTLHDDGHEGVGVTHFFPRHMIHETFSSGEGLLALHYIGTNLLPHERLGKYQLANAAAVAVAVAGSSLLQEPTQPLQQTEVDKKVEEEVKAWQEQQLQQQVQNNIFPSAITAAAAVNITGPKELFNHKWNQHRHHMEIKAGSCWFRHCASCGVSLSSTSKPGCRPANVAEDKIVPGDAIEVPPSLRQGVPKSWQQFPQQ